MKPLKNFTLLLVLLLLLPGAFPARAGADGFPDQTILIYIVGSDLESESGLATSDIREMLGSQFDQERVNLLVMTGGATRWSARSIPDDKLSIFKIEGSRPALQNQREAASMGEADTLLHFMRYAVEHHPASSYALIFWDHGGGPLVGIGADLLFRKDGLNLEELKSAFERGPFQGENRLEWLAFDACLMASAEVAHTLAPYARYMIASEETLPGNGFNYDFLKEYAASDLSGLSAGQMIIDRTGAYYERLKVDRPDLEFLVTLSLLDLDRLPPVLSALDGLFSDLSQGLEARVYSDMARRRDGTKAYGRAATTDEFDLVDLYDLAQNMAALYPEGAQALGQAISDLVVYNYANVPRSHGLSLYFPLLNKPRYEKGWSDIYQRFSHAPAYQAFVRDFGGILLDDRLSNWAGSEAPAVTYDEQTAEYYIQLSPNQAAHYERAEYYILTRLQGEEYMLNFMSSDVVLDSFHRLRANFDGKVMSLRERDSVQDIYPYLVEKENLDGIARYQIPALLNRRTAEGGLEIVHAELLAEINKVDGTARVTGAIKRHEEEELLGKRDLQLSDFESVYMPYASFYLTRGKEGEVLPLGDWVGSDSMRMAGFSTDDVLNARFEPLRDEGLEHFMLISVTDTQGFSFSSELIPLSLPLKGREDPSPRVTIDFPQNGAPTALFDQDGLAATMFGFDFSSAQTGDKVAPDTLHLKLMLENRRQADLQVELDWLGANGTMVDAWGQAAVKAGGTAELILDIPIAPQAGGIGLVDAGIRELDSLLFRLKHRPLDANFISETYTQEVLIHTALAVGAGYDPPARDPAQNRVLLEEAGFVIELAGELGIEEGDFQLPLSLTNRSADYDRLDLALASINGISAPLYLPGALPRGYTRHATLAIPLARTVLGEEFKEYQYLFDGLDNLEALGITRVQEVKLHFTASASDPSIAPPRALKTARVDLKRSDESPDQPLDTEGDIIFDDGGVTLTRLHSDPEGKRFYIKNSNAYAVRLTSFGRVTVDGAAYGDNMPILQTVPGRASAYTLLFGFLPGIFPEGEELAFTLNLIHQEENRLLLQSDPITLRLK